MPDFAPSPPDAVAYMYELVYRFNRRYNRWKEIDFEIYNRARKHYRKGWFERWQRLAKRKGKR